MLLMAENLCCGLADRRFGCAFDMSKSSCELKLLDLEKKKGNQTHKLAFDTCLEDVKTLTVKM